MLIMAEGGVKPKKTRKINDHQDILITDEDLLVGRTLIQGNLTRRLTMHSEGFLFQMVVQTLNIGCLMSLNWIIILLNFGYVYEKRTQTARKVKLKTQIRQETSTAQTH